MSASPPLSPPRASSPPTPPDSPKPCNTLECFLCDRCRYPIGSLGDLLPAEATAPLWKEHVFRYELDLFSKGSPPVQAYSATNPSERRFDFMCLAPHVTIQGLPHSCDAGDPTTAAPALDTEKSKDATEKQLEATLQTHTDSLSTIRFPPFVECNIGDYYIEHTFFPGYAWCYCCCTNCGAFLGWGFAAEERLRAARRPIWGDKRSTPARKSEDRQEDERKTIATDVVTTPTTGNSRSTESGATHVAPAAPLDQHGEQSHEEDSHGGDPSEPHDSNKDGSEELMVGDVTPDFIAVIITHCSSEPHYPLLSLLKEAIWRPIRQRRRLHIEEVKGIFDDFMVRMNDASRAQEMYLQFRAMELLLYPHVPRVFAPSSGEHASLVDELTLDVDENGVPRRMHDLVEAAAEVVRQQLSSDAREKKCTSSATSSAASIDNNC